MNPVFEVLSAHRSIRKYTGAPIPDDVIEQAVRAAQQAPTSSHVQAYCLIQVTDREERATLAELTGGQAQVAEAGAFFAVCGDQRRHQLVAEDAGKPFAPNLESFLVATIDASLFAQNLVIAFESLGYGTCYIGGLRTKIGEVDRLLELPNGVFPLYGLCVGERAQDAKCRDRLPTRAVWCKGRYPSDETVRALVAEHDRDMAREYEARGLAGRNWSGGIQRKFAKPAREHLAEYYASKGARLE